MADLVIEEKEQLRHDADTWPRQQKLADSTSLIIDSGICQVTVTKHLESTSKRALILYSILIYDMAI